MKLESERFKMVDFGKGCQVCQDFRMWLIFLDKLIS